MKQGKHGSIPDYFDHHWLIARLPDFMKCWIYHPLKIFSPSIAAMLGYGSCPVCGIKYS